VAAQQEADRDAVARWLETHPGVGPITALAFSLTLGTIERFAHSRQVISYLGLNPAEHSSGGRQRLGAISQQGNPLLRSGLVEAGQSAARCVPELKRAYQRLKHRKTFGCGQGHGSAQTGGAAVGCGRTGSPTPPLARRAARVILWSRFKTVHLNGRPASRRSLGVRRQESWSPRPAIE